jgi:hypothetical protein
MMKISILALIAAIAAPSVAFAGSSQLVIHESDQWRPGYTKDEGSKYIHLSVEKEVHNQTMTIERDVRNSWAPGYTLEDGKYVRDVKVVRVHESVPTTSLTKSTSWMPGMNADGDGTYYSLDEEHKAKMRK